MPGAATSAKYSTVVRKFHNNETRGLAGGRAGQLLASVSRIKAKATPKDKKIKGTAHLKEKSGYQWRMHNLGWNIASPFDPRGWQSFLLDRHGNVIAYSALVPEKTEARRQLRGRIFDLLQEYDEGRF